MSRELLTGGQTVGRYIRTFLIPRLTARRMLPNILSRAREAGSPLKAAAPALTRGTPQDPLARKPFQC